VRHIKGILYNLHTLSRDLCSVTVEGVWILTGLIGLFDTARDYISCSAIVAVKICLFAEPLLNNDCCIVAYFVVVV
jgi:hypothetical protein